MSRICAWCECAPCAGSAVCGGWAGRLACDHRGDGQHERETRRQEEVELLSGADPALALRGADQRQQADRHQPCEGCVDGEVSGPVVVEEPGRPHVDRLHRARLRHHVTGFGPAAHEQRQHGKVEEVGEAVEQPSDRRHQKARGGTERDARADLRIRGQRRDAHRLGHQHDAPAHARRKEERKQNVRSSAETAFAPTVLHDRPAAPAKNEAESRGVEHQQEQRDLESTPVGRHRPVSLVLCLQHREGRERGIGALVLFSFGSLNTCTSFGNDFKYTCE